jgi:hypothetical protein
MPFTFNNSDTCSCGNLIADQNRSGICRTCYAKRYRVDKASQGPSYTPGAYSNSTDWGFDILGNLFRLHGDV